MFSWYDVMRVVDGLIFTGGHSKWESWVKNETQRTVSNLAFYFSQYIEISKEKEIKWKELLVLML